MDGSNFLIGYPIMAISEACEGNSETGQLS